MAVVGHRVEPTPGALRAAAEDYLLSLNLLGIRVVRVEQNGPAEFWALCIRRDGHAVTAVLRGPRPGRWELEEYRFGWPIP